MLDHRIAICVKPAGAPSTDEPGGVPELLRAELGTPDGCALTVHRLDRVTGGLMVLARSHAAASILSRQIAEGTFQKEYLAVINGAPPETGTMKDLLIRDRARRMTTVASSPQRGAQEAELDYRVLASRNGRSLVRIRLHTGRTHQIRAQFSSRGWPLVGDRKYGAPPEEAPGVALWSFRLCFDHPQTGKRIDVSLPPPKSVPWTEFEAIQWNH